MSFGAAGKLKRIEGENVPGRWSVWLLPHLLSLDAPLVALAWQGQLAAHTNLPLKLASRAVLALTVWLIYIADRLLDVRASRAVPQTARHRFYQQHQHLALTLLISIAAADLTLIAVSLPRAVLRNGLVFCGAVLGYMLVVHAPRTRPLIPKEFLVALIFTAGTFITAWTRTPDPLVDLGAPVVSFFLLCLSNLVLIEMWEGAELRSTELGRPHWTTAALARTYPVWVSLLAAVCIYRSGSAWYRAMAISATGMLLLYFTGRRLNLDARCALADAFLMAPFFFR